MAGNSFVVQNKRIIHTGNDNHPVYSSNTRMFKRVVFNMTFGSMNRTSEFYSIPLLRYNYIHSLR